MPRVALDFLEEDYDFKEGEVDLSDSLPEVSLWDGHVSEVEFQSMSIIREPDLYLAYSAYLRYKDLASGANDVSTLNFRDMEGFYKWYNDATREEIIESFDIWKRAK